MAQFRVALTENTVREALNTVTDPCSLVAGVRAGLVDMGLISSVEIGGGCVRVTIGLTEPGCLMGHAFIPQARAALAALPGVTEVDVRMDYTLAFSWNEQRMTLEYRERLEAHRAHMLERLQQRAGQKNQLRTT